MGRSTRLILAAAIALTATAAPAYGASADALGGLGAQERSAIGTGQPLSQFTVSLDGASTTYPDAAGDQLGPGAATTADITLTTVTNDAAGVLTIDVDTNRPAVTANDYFQMLIDRDSNPMTRRSDRRRGRAAPRPRRRDADVLHRPLQRDELHEHPEHRAGDVDRGARLRREPDGARHRGSGLQLPGGHVLLPDRQRNADRSGSFSERGRHDVQLPLHDADAAAASASSAPSTATASASASASSAHTADAAARHHARRTRGSRAGRRGGRGAEGRRSGSVRPRRARPSSASWTAVPGRAAGRRRPTGTSGRASTPSRCERRTRRGIRTARPPSGAGPSGASQGRGTPSQTSRALEPGSSRLGTLP